MTSKWVPTKAESTAVVEGKKAFFGPVRTLPDPKTLSFRVELNIESQSVIFDFTSDSKDLTNGAVLDPLKPDFSKGIFTARSAEKSAEKPSEDGISFSGKVQLPPAKRP
ncbi:MAG: hypothetical protein ABR543_18635 [Gemmatimonadaceae bacterium]